MLKKHQVPVKKYVLLLKAKTCTEGSAALYSLIHW